MSASARGPIWGGAGDCKFGMVGRVFRVYKRPLGPAVEVGGTPPLRPPPPRPPHGIMLAAVEWPLAGLLPPKRRCTGGDRARGLQTAQSPLEGAFPAFARRLATKTRRAGWLVAQTQAPG